MTALDYTLVSFVVFGVGAVVIYTLTKLFRDAASSQGSAAQRTARYISVSITGWALLAVIYSLAIGLSFPKLVPMLVVPWSAGLWLMFSSTGSNLLREVPVHKLIALSCYRVAGIIFIYCYYFCGTLSRGFALNAGWGDVLTGVLALPIAMMVKSGSRHSLLAFALWTIIGIGDLILAPVSAAIYGAQDLPAFPINLIPLFLGPPFGILLHLVTVRAYWLQCAEDENAA